MADYKNGKIYCIKTYKTDLIYIGSTTQQLCRRMTDHRSNYKRYKNGKYRYTTSYEILKLGDAYIELLESFECSCMEDLHKKEGEYIRNTKCVNKRIPGRTRKESYKQWYEKNKYNIAKKKKEYELKNKDKLAKKHKEYYEKNKNKIAKNMEKYRKMNKCKIKKYMKEYYKNNKYKKKQYYEKNKDKLAAKTPCPHCGKVMRKDGITAHIKKYCKKVPK